MVTRGVAVFVGVLVGCAPTPSHTIPVALLVDGNLPVVPSAAVAGLELTPVALPRPSAAPVDPAVALIARARTSYAKGDFDTCHAELAKIDVAKILAARDRPLAARALLLDGACAWGATDKGAAQAIATRFASYKLELPDLAVSPDVERVFGDAIGAAGASALSPLEVRGQPGARLALDGREAGCTLPCTLDVANGDHVLGVDADGYESAERSVRAPSPPISIPQQPADAALAARQWRARVGRGLPPADVVGAELLGKLSKSSRVAFIHGDARITGTLVVDGKLVATATAARGDAPSLMRELAYDGGILRRPAVWQRPWFWIAASGAAILISGAIVAVTYKRPIDTSVGF